MAWSTVLYKAKLKNRLVKFQIIYFLRSIRAYLAKVGQTVWLCLADNSDSILLQEWRASFPLLFQVHESLAFQHSVVKILSHCQRNRERRKVSVVGELLGAADSFQRRDAKFDSRPSCLSGWNIRLNLRQINNWREQDAYITVLPSKLIAYLHQENMGPRWEIVKTRIW